MTGTMVTGCDVKCAFSADEFIVSKCCSVGVVVLERLFLNSCLLSKLVSLVIFVQYQAPICLPRSSTNDIYLFSAYFFSLLSSCGQV